MSSTIVGGATERFLLLSVYKKQESDPNMSNLMALAKLYGVAIEEILKQVS